MTGNLGALSHDDCTGTGNESKCGGPVSNPVLDNIYSRRSVRNYADKEVPDEVINEIIRAGSYAPSAVNIQPWRFVVINNRQLISGYSARAKKAFIEMHKDTKDPNMAGLVQYMMSSKSELFYGAPLLILVFSAPDAVGENDSALAAENMMLAAWSLGIGSCWIGLANGLGQDRDFLKEVKVPEGYRLVAPLIFGYPARKNPKAPARKDNLVLSWIK